MEKHIYDAYLSDGWKLFALYKTKNDEGVKGRYSTPKGWNDMSVESDAYNPTTVYGGVPPSDICVIDWDTKNGKQGLVSFTQLQVDLGSQIPTTVNTPSGGGHAYVRIPPQILLSKKQMAYPDIDFQGHGREWVVCGGQIVDGYGEYEFTDPVDEYFVNELSTIVGNFGFQTRNDLDRSHSYGAIDPDDHYMSRIDRATVEEWLEQLDPDMSYDAGWQQVIMALNSWDLGGSEGLELAIRWSQGARHYNASEDEITEKYYSSVADTPEFYKKILGMVNQKDMHRFVEMINQATTTDELEIIAEEISTSHISKSDREKLADQLVEKDKGKDFYGRKRLPYWTKAIKYKVVAAPITDIDSQMIKVYLNGNNYVLQIGGIIITDLSLSSTERHLKALGILKPKDYTDMAVPIGGVLHRMDYTLKSDFAYSFAKVEVTAPDYLVIHRNPMITFEVDRSADDEAIINEFCNEVWNGKVEDIVRLIALSIKFREGKLNRLMIVAPSNSGKTEIGTHLKFQKITINRLIHAITGVKGVGAQIIHGIRATGLLLIDEVNTTLPQEIKDLDKEIHIDQFGSFGTQVLPLMFTVLTSTHKAATRNNSDELYNRFLQVELTEAEMQHNVTDGKMYRLDSSRYSDVIMNYLRGIFKDTIYGDDTIEELRELQAKYRLPLNNDLDEFIYETSLKVINTVRESARDNEHGDYIHRSGEYFCKRKSDIHDIVIDYLSQLSGIDHQKYAEKIMNHLLGEQKSIKIGGTPVKYYRVNTKAFSLDEEQSIVDEFDDL